MKDLYTKKSNYNSRKAVLYIVSIGFSIFIVFTCYSFYKIYSGVKSVCIEAKHEFQQDCVNSLIAYFKSDIHTSEEKNHAIWALGQLADKKALPFLKEIEKEFNCPGKYKYDSYRCYEIKKAIKWCMKGNATNWMYKNRENWKKKCLKEEMPEMPKM